jgi:hypothetical protein
MKLKIKEFSFDSGTIKWWQYLLATIIALATIFKNELLDIFL